MKNRNELIVDLETIADVDGEILQELRAELRAPVNWKDPLKIRDEITRQATALEEKAALSPLTGCIVAVSIAMRRADESRSWSFATLMSPPSSVTFPTVDRKPLEDPEHAILRALVEQVGSFVDPVLVTFNGRFFDRPFLQARLARHNLADCLPTAFTAIRDHIDLYQVLGGQHELGLWTRRILGKKKAGEPTDIPGWIAEGRWDQLYTYSLRDVELEAELYDRLGALSLLRPRS